MNINGKLNKKLEGKKDEVRAYFKGDDAIQLVYLFGSAANRESIGDFDFGVYLDELSAKDRFDKGLEISASLSAILGTDAVDVVVMNDAPMRLNFEIINGKNLFCRDKSKRLDLESSVSSFYHDRRYYERRHDEIFLQCILGENMKESEKIILKLEKLREYLRHLKSWQKHSLKEIKEDYVLRSAIERNLHLAIESALDVGEIIPKSLSKKLVIMAKFRNVLVHRYTEIEIERVYEHLMEDLDDLEEFMKVVSRYVSRKS